MNLKKLTSLLLSLVMMVTLVPFAAMAEGTSVNTIKVSDSAAGDFVKLEGDVSVTVGNTIYIKLYTDETEITGFTNENFTYSTNSDAAITVENNTIKVETKTTTDYFDFKVLYNGAEWSFKINIGSNSSGSTGGEGGDDGSNPSQPTEVIMCYSVDGGDSWNQYNYKNQESTPNGIEIDATKQEGTYKIKFIDGNNEPVAVSYPRHDGESDVIGFIGNDSMQPTGFTVITKGINGIGYYNFENNSIGFDCQVKFTVTGNPENPYTAAKVVPVQLGASTVTVATGLTGQLSNAAEGFALADGTLTFANTANAGSFDATVGSQMYTVVIFPTAGDALTEDLAIKVDTDDSVITTYLGTSGFAANEYNFVTFDNGTARDIVSSDNFMFGKNASGAYTPTYVYKTSNGVLADFDNSYIVQAVNAYMGHTSYLVKTELKEINGVDVLKVYPLTEYAGTTVKKNTMVLGQLTITKDDGSVINQNVGTTDEETELKGTNGFGSDVWWMDVGAVAETEKTFYIRNGQLAALYDTVDISTLKVQSTNSSNVKVEEFYTTKGTENAIGFKLSIANTENFVSELVKVSFKNKKTDADEQFYIPVICRDKEEAITTTVIPEQASQLQEIYDKFNGTILYLQEGEYATDLYMWRGNVTIKGLGNGAVFTGSEGTSKPILTFGYDGYSNINSQMSGYNNFRMFTNIAIDGKNKTKTGIKVEDGIALNLMKSAPTNSIGLDYIKNCDVAILSTNKASNSTVNVYGLTFENNNVAIKVGHSLGYAFVGNHTKEILENNFIGNTTDFEVTDTNAKISIPQNFYADTNGTMKQAGPTVVGTTNIDYMPYYTTADRDTVQAQLSTVATAAESTEIEIPVTLMQTDKAVKFDKTLFEQIKNATAEYKVSVPVREKGDKIYSIWNFDSTKLADKQPDATTLKVTNTLSTDAQAVVDKIDTTQTTVAQAVNFSHSGNLPGETTVYVLKDGTTTIENLKLYYINTTSGELKLVDLNDAKVTEVTVDGVVYYAVTIDHCSEYIISTNVVLKETTGGETDEGGEDDNTGGATGGETGDASGSTGDTNGSTGSTSGTTTQPATTPAPTATAKPTSGTTDKAPTTANDFVSAQEVEAKLEKASDNEVVVDVTDKELVSAKAFEVLADYPEATLAFEGEDYEWSFNAADITDAAAIDGTIFNTKISLESPNKAKIKAAAGDAEIIHIYFSHHGKLPGKATVSIFVGENQAGNTKYVHYFDDADNSFEFITETVVQDNGWVTFEITHCSDYVLSDKLLDTAAETEKEETGTTENEQTGEETVTEPTETETNGSAFPIAIVVIIVIVIAAAIIFIKKRKAE